MSNRNEQGLKKIGSATAIALAIAALSAPAAAADDKQLEALQKQLQLLQQEIEKIKQQQAKAPAPAPAAASDGVGSALGSAITVYGVLDGGFEHLTGVAAGTGKRSVTRMPSITGTVASRLGFNVGKEIRPGLKAIATLEAGVNFDDGTLGQGGRIFGRQMFAGLQTEYGSFTFGRQYSMLLYGMGESDLIGPNIYALGSLDNYLPNARYDNSVAWRHKIGKVSLGATYSTGRDAKGTVPVSFPACAGETAGAPQCQGWSAMLRYDDAAFGVGVAVDEMRGGGAATTSFYNGATAITFNRGQDSDRRINVNGLIKLGAGHKIGLGWLGRQVHAAAGTVESDAYYLTGAYKVSDALVIDGGINHIRNQDQDRDATLLVLRGTYAIDKDFATYLQVGHIDNSARAQYALSVGAGIAPPAGGSQYGTMLGLRYRF